MTTERCAELCLLALVNRLEEAWIGLFPIVPMIYLSQYAPTITKRLLALVGQKGLQNVRDSKNTMKVE